MGFLGTTASSLSDLSLVVLLAAAALITVGWRRATAGDGARHRFLVLSGVALAWIFFLTYMLNRTIAIVTGQEGATFPGPDSWRSTFWLPLIGVHSLAATVALAWSVAQVWHGYRHAFKPAPGAWSMAGERRRRHARGGRAFLVLWYVTTLTGVLVYLSLYVFWA